VAICGLEACRKGPEASIRLKPAPHHMTAGTMGMSERNMENVAYTDEYRLRRERSNWLFDLEPLEDEVFYLDDDKEYEVRHLSFGKMEVRADGRSVYFSAKRVTVSRADGTVLLDYRTTDDVPLVELIRHKNGKGYIIFKTGLYGYSVMEIEGGDIAHYVPKHSFDEGGETFIWTGVLYCEANNLLAAEGCYWACDWTNEFYDFSDPMTLPLPFYCDGYELNEHQKMDLNVFTVGFTDKGECILEGADEDNASPLKTIDVIGWSKNKTS